MNRKYLYLIVASLVVIALFIPLALVAQQRDERVPPPPPLYMPGELPPGMERRATLAPDKRATPTLNAIEAQKLPQAKRPERKPVTVIDTAPDILYGNKYQIILKNDQSKDKIFILIPVSVYTQIKSSKETLNKIVSEYVGSQKGYQVLRISPPPPIHNQGVEDQ